ncbi:unnamed protein product [Lota lota]
MARGARTPQARGDQYTAPRFSPHANVTQAGNVSLRDPSSTEVTGGHSVSSEARHGPGRRLIIHGGPREEPILADRTGG